MRQGAGTKPGGARGLGRSLVRFRPVESQDASTVLLCFPHAGAGARAYATWAGALPPEIDLVAVLPPGRETRVSEPIAANLAGLVDDIVNDAEALLDRPVAIFGHSLGALVGFEFARRMAQLGVPSRHLFVSGRRAPQLPQDDPLARRLSDAAFTERLMGMNGIPAELFRDPDLLDLFLPIFRADYDLSETHRDQVEPRLTCPVTAYAGADDGQTTEAGIDAWAERSTGRFRRRMFDGGHFFLWPGRDALLADICGELGLAVPTESPANLPVTGLRATG